MNHRLEPPHFQQPQSLAPDLLSSNSSIKDYTTLPPKKRIERALRFFQMDVADELEKEGERDMTKNNVKEFVIAQKALKLSPDECEELMYELTAKLFNEKKGINTFKALKVMGKTLLPYFDLVTDVMVFLELRGKNMTMAVVQGITLAFSIVAQSLLSWLAGQPKLVVLSGLVGFKPAIEAWRDATNAKPYTNQITPTNTIEKPTRNLLLRSLHE